MSCQALTALLAVFSVIAFLYAGCCLFCPFVFNAFFDELLIYWEEVHGLFLVLQFFLCVLLVVAYLRGRKREASLQSRSQILENVALGASISSILTDVQSLLRYDCGVLSCAVIAFDENSKHCRFYYPKDLQDDLKERCTFIPYAQVRESFVYSEVMAGRYVVLNRNEICEDVHISEYVSSVDLDGLWFGPIYCSDGHVKGIFVISTDDCKVLKFPSSQACFQSASYFSGVVLEREVALKSLKHNRRRLADFAESSSDCFWEADQLLNVTYFDAMSSSLSSLGADDIQYMLRELAIDPKIITKDAFQHKMIYLEHEGFSLMISFAGKVVFDFSGDIVGYRGTATDMTALFKAENDAVLSEKKFRGIFDNARIGMVVLDNKGVVQFANESYCHILGYSADEVRGRSFLDFTLEEDKEESSKRFLNLLEGNKISYEVEKLYSHKNGGEIPVLLTVTCVRSYDGQPLYTIAQVQDWREREKAKRLEGMLQRSRKMEYLGNLAGGIAHEFNNLLVPVIGLADLALKNEKEGSVQHGHLSIILKSARQASNLVRSLMVFSRGGEDDFSPEVASLADVVDDAFGLLRMSVPENISLVVEKDDASLDALVCQEKVQQIILNLVLNAKDALKEKREGKISISLRNLSRGDVPASVSTASKSEDFVRLRVSDNGEGMDKSTLRQVFDPFFTTKRVHNGTGMGMSVVFGIVDRHDGYILVSSTLGEGTDIDVYFPHVSQVVEEVNAA